eukprot:gene5360-9168_t
MKTITNKIQSSVQIGKQFEKETISTLKKLNFNIKNTKSSYDRGIDFFGKWNLLEDCNIIGQCKCEKKPLGEKYIRELEGTLSHHDENQKNPSIGILVSSNGYSNFALNYHRTSSYSIILATYKEKPKKVEQTYNTSITKQPDIILSWERDENKGKLPSERGFHTTTIVGNTKLFISGGDAKNQYFKEILVYDTATSKWLATKNLPPSMPNSRSGHTCNLYNNKLYIYGGKQKHKYLSSLVILDLLTNEWRKPKFSQDNLKTRGAHTATILNHCLYIYGGLTPSEEDNSLIYLPDIIIFDLIKERWLVPTIEGSIPLGRAGHSATVVGQDIFVFGGRSGSLLLQDSYLFSTKRLSWIKIHPSGNIPCARAGHTIENFDNNSLILYGGSNWTLFFSSVFIYNLDKAEWREIITDGEIPEPRIWHTSSIIGLKMYIFGGGNEKSLFKSIYSLDLFQLKNKKIKEEEGTLIEEIIEENVKIKTVYNDETRAFLFPKSFNFTDLLSKLSDEYQELNLTINYLDDEEDLITIRGNDDLSEAIRFFKKNEKILKFFIKIQREDMLSNKNTSNNMIGSSKDDIIQAVLGDLLGSGAFGKVFLGMNTMNGSLIAIKQIPIKGSKNKKNSILKDVINEINLMKILNHENIVRYLGAETVDEYLHIYLEYVSGGSIQQLLSKFKKFQESVVKLYTKQILYGLKYLHDNNIIHRDIKGGNILLTENGIIKLADFGHSKSLDQLDLKKSYKGTPLWMAPEVANSFQYSKSSDIWALGCTIIEMLTGKPPYPELLLSDPIAIIRTIGNDQKIINPTIPQNISKELNFFLKSCFQRDPKDRFNVNQLIDLLELNDDISSNEIIEINNKTIELIKDLQEDSGENSPVNSDYFETFPDESYHSRVEEDDEYDDEYEEDEYDEEEEEESESDEEEEIEVEEKIDISYQKSSRFDETLKSINQQISNLEIRQRKTPKFQKPILQLNLPNEKVADKNDIIQFLQQQQKKQNRSIKSFQNQNQKSFNYYN